MADAVPEGFLVSKGCTAFLFRHLVPCTGLFRDCLLYTSYYEALQASSSGWHENQNTYAPFVKYYLGIIIKAYDEFEDRIQYLVTRKISKPDVYKRQT